MSNTRKKVSKSTWMPHHDAASLIIKQFGIQAEGCKKHERTPVHPEVSNYVSIRCGNMQAFDSG